MLNPTPLPHATPSIHLQPTSGTKASCLPVDNLDWQAGTGDQIEVRADPRGLLFKWIGGGAGSRPQAGRGYDVYVDGKKSDWGPLCRGTTFVSGPIPFEAVAHGQVPHGKGKADIEIKKRRPDREPPDHR